MYFDSLCQGNLLEDIILKDYFIGKEVLNELINEVFFSQLIDRVHNEDIVNYDFMLIYIKTLTIIVYFLRNQDHFVYNYQMMLMTSLINQNQMFMLIRMLTIVLQNLNNLSIVIFFFNLCFH
jgi:hypothetical protein